VKIRFLEDAEDELVASIEFYEGRVSGLGIDFYEEVRKATDLIKASPDTWPIKRYKCKCFFLDRFPFAIYYYPKNEITWIVAIAHSSRRPFYWKARVARIKE